MTPPPSSLLTAAPFRLTPRWSYSPERRDAIDTLVTKGDRQYVFVDTAGVRRKRSVSAPVEMTSVMHAIRAMERCDVVVEGLAD